MKKNWIGYLLVFILLIPNIVHATPLDFSGGVHNEYVYEEMVFITGAPVKFTGTYSVSENERKGKITVNYKFSLKPEDKSIDGKLDRNITFITTLTNHGDKSQTVGQTEISKYSETIKIDGNTYTLTDYQFSKSDNIDNMPASDFYLGIIKGRKHYNINRTEGEVIIDISGGNAGYKNFWGSTETLIIDQVITSKYYISDAANEGTQSWQGTISIQVSDSLTKTLKYSENSVNLSSFEGGFARVTNRSVVSRYEYNLPDDKGTIKLNQSMVPKLEMLIVPKFRDVNGHWAQDEIKKLYSLEVFEDNSEIFAPDITVNRLEFIKAVIRACDIRPSLDEGKTAVKSKNEPLEVSKFIDISVKHPDYKYIKEGLNKGIITGTSGNTFGPAEPLTRAQAITILIRALGFENKAPNPGYVTSFADDSKIPNWAKDSIYVAREVNLVSGDTYNRINPDKVLTRAEASSMLVRFLEFLEKDLQKDYRENIMNFY
ncbi:MAG TPA: S-layer homology domain-containing protein [Clostridiales bacterium]|nr:S-layer homology domain-containing protein [Clostridiales bacterium]